MSRFKFLGSKGQMVKPDVYVVDKAINPKLHADVLADTEPIPEGSIVVLVDGATSIAKLAVKQSPWSEGLGLGSGGAGGSVAWADITGKPAVIGAGATAAAARTAIGAIDSTANTASATKLATARTFTFSTGATGSGSFDGTANVTVALTLATPTASVKGGVTQQTAIADLTAAPTQADFNGLLAKLRTSGLLAP